MSHWTNFLVVISAQLVLLLLLAYSKQGLKKITFTFVLQSLFLGIVAGIIFDLVVGKYIGIFDYALDFTPMFLVLNGALSYGIWILTIRILQSERLLQFFVWTVLIGLIYEVVNYFFRVWYWTFEGSFLYQEAVVIFVAYCGLGLLTTLWLSITIKKEIQRS